MYLHKGANPAFETTCPKSRTGASTSRKPPEPRTLQLVPQPRFPQALRLFAAATVTLGLLAAAPSSAAESQATQSITRCGWFDNPTPGNAWLTDRDAEWIISVQGGHQAEGDWPEFRLGDWISTNRSYGYGCACLSVLANHSTHEVQRIVKARARPISACKKDPSLPARRPER